MSRSTIIPTFFRSSLLSRRHCASVLRPPNLLGSISRVYEPSAAAGRIGIHPNLSHLSLPAFALRAFSTSPAKNSTPAPFTYSISASYSDKRQNLDLSRNIFSFDPSSRKSSASAHAEAEEPRPRVQSGQDAFFISSIGETNNVAFGVVDGVGGWEESGVDPADFAHSLCDYMADAALRYPHGFDKVSRGQLLQPVDLLDIGYDQVMADPAIPAGGCTACIATASSNGLLNVANLGDSGYIHLSPFRLNFLSPAQTHRFNTPFQLSKLPKKMLEQVALFGGAKPYSEVPSDSALTQQTLEHGDVLVFATDGVWDNLSAEDALRLVTRIMVQLKAWVLPEEGAPGVSPDFVDIVRNATLKVPASPGSASADASVKGLSAVLATAITHEAKAASLDTKRDGPFAKEVQRLYPDENWKGGKADDICTIVAVVTQEGR
ncbi:uncharacterized protein PV09_04927 [Verruconis gallopava]|uniref:Protein phosphatase n=1 Tax=Verruconis gallopava TaxID=253628 RepID=A0A0D1YTY0_9PEZI|nr:uncharacterized protein PV09_04927 [Verruconis gallopava]KIW04117.1 hypothetical protein PV09_04927 [Verruconis gallopava]